MIIYRPIGPNDYPVFWKLLNAYYRDGEDADTDQAVLDSFIKDLFNLVTGNQIQGCFLQAEDNPVLLRHLLFPLPNLLPMT